jgi:hypothetical protein
MDKIKYNGIEWEGSNAILTLDGDEVDRIDADLLVEEMLNNSKIHRRVI